MEFNDMEYISEETTEEVSEEITEEASEETTEEVPEETTEETEQTSENIVYLQEIASNTNNVSLSDDINYLSVESVILFIIIYFIILSFVFKGVEND